MRRAILAAAVALLATTTASAQSVQVGGSCILPVPRDTINAIITANVVAFDPKQRVPPDYVATVAQEIVRHMTVPPGLTLAAFHTSRNDSTLAYPAEVTMAELILGRTGGVLQATTITRALAPEFDTLVLAAARRASDASAFPPPPPRARGDSLAFRVLLAVGEGIGDGEMLVARLRSPAWRLSERAWPVEPTPQPRYPPRMQRGNVEGDVVLDFVVGMDSVPLAPTLRVVRYTSPEFWDEVRAIFPQVRIRPGRVGACAIPVRVRQPFFFRLR